MPTTTCACSTGEAQRDELMVDFLAEGVQARHKCYCMIAPTEHARIASAVGSQARARDVGDNLEFVGPSGSHMPIVKVHPKVWVDGLVVTNRYYLDSEYLLADEVEDLVRDGVSAGESPRPPPRGGRPFCARGAGCSSACIDSGAWPRSPSWPTRWPGAPHRADLPRRARHDRPRGPPAAARRRRPARAGGAGHPPGPRARPGRPWNAATTP
jgi:hypothetical protein